MVERMVIFNEATVWSGGSLGRAATRPAERLNPAARERRGRSMAFLPREGDSSRVRPAHVRT
jgi:hypothetical protein